MASTHKQRGRLSKSEKDLIKSMIDAGATPEAIAKKTNRTVEFIQEFSAAVGHRPDLFQDSDLEVIRRQLRLRPEYQFFKQTYTDNELGFFE